MSRERANQYQSAYAADYGFESVMVHYRREMLLERLARHRPRVVVEVGCGSELLYSAWLRHGAAAECWVVVEPAEQFASAARASGLPGLCVINDYFELAVPSVKACLPRQPDMVICSSLLHEVPSEAALLGAILDVMGNASILHVNVPNSESMHRRLAKVMGLISDTKAISERNANLMQSRVYDMQSLKAGLTKAGLSVTGEGGYLVKPFTHAQMEKIRPVIGDRVLDGLFKLGVEMPELASEIFVEAHRASRE